MLSYQHSYHAGNFADVFKHATLACILQYLLDKPKPLFCLETHAGRGFYDLLSAESRKTGEAQHGVFPIWEARNSLPPSFAPWIALLRKLNTENTLRFYPGSPAILVEMLRSEDRLYGCELHPREFSALSALPRFGKKVFFSQENGLDALRALLPPKERRGLIFMDPAFEQEREYTAVPAAIRDALRRFATGVYCLWYPVIDKKLHERLVRGLSIPGTHALQGEFWLTDAPSREMVRCGLWVINPPWVLQEQMTAILQSMQSLQENRVSSFMVKYHEF